MPRCTLPLVLALCVFSLITGGMALGVYRLTHGSFTYTLDDPYIHLTLARQLGRGEYGINPGEFAAPSSSILWPLLLAPFTRLAFAELIPLFINLACSAGTLYVAFRLAAPRGLYGAVFMGLLVVCGNLVGNSFNGMEHSLQALLTLLGVWGITRLEEEGKAPWWLALALFLGPLVRFENLLLSGIGIGWLLLRRQYRLAGLTALGLCLALGGFVWFLISHGAGPLPTSVQAKAGLGGFGKNVIRPEGTALFTIALLLGSGALLGKVLPRQDRALAALAAVLILAHLVGGLVDFGRYELYVWLLGTTLLIRFYWSASRFWQVGPWLAFLIGYPYVLHTYKTPLACQSIYEQQAQMARFARQWKRPVAVNDIGLVGLRGGVYVLDVFGLAHPEALRARREKRGTAWLDTATRQHQIDLVMVYDSWFPAKPAGWLKVGSFTPSQPVGYLGGLRVSFWATRPESAPEIQQALKAFAPTLPEKLRFEWQALPERSPESQ